MRDMSEREFTRKMEALGFERGYFMGYWRLPLGPDRHVSVSCWNAGPRWRDRLAFMLRELERYQKEGRD